MEESRQPVSIESLLRHRAWVRRLALSMVRDEATADDLVQETWVATPEKPPQHEGVIRTWLRRVMLTHASSDVSGRNHPSGLDAVIETMEARHPTLGRAVVEKVADAFAVGEVRSGSAEVAVRYTP